PNVLYAGDGGAGEDEGALWRCVNCGSSPIWELMDGREQVHTDYHAMAWSGSRFIVGNDGGVWSTADHGNSWQEHNATFSTSMFYSAALHPTNPNFILSGMRDFQLAVRRGAGWFSLPLTNGTTWGEAEVALSTGHPDTDWMGAFIWGAITRTTDGG